MCPATSDLIILEMPLFSKIVNLINIPPPIRLEMAFFGMFVGRIGGQKEYNCTTFLQYFSKTNFCSLVLNKVTAELYQIFILMHSLNATWITSR